MPELSNLIRQRLGRQKLQPRILMPTSSARMRKVAFSTPNALS